MYYIYFAKFDFWQGVCTSYENIASIWRRFLSDSMHTNTKTHLLTVQKKQKVCEKCSGWRVRGAAASVCRGRCRGRGALHFTHFFLTDRYWIQGGGYVPVWRATFCRRVLLNRTELEYINARLVAPVRVPVLPD